jgi:hypothetical protein
MHARLLCHSLFSLLPSSSSSSFVNSFRFSFLSFASFLQQKEENRAVLLNLGNSVEREGTEMKEKQKKR